MFKQLSISLNLNGGHGATNMSSGAKCPETLAAAAPAQRHRCQSGGIKLPPGPKSMKMLIINNE